jgi:hypothetical protein
MPLRRMIYKIECRRKRQYRRRRRRKKYPCVLCGLDMPIGLTRTIAFTLEVPT